MGSYERFIGILLEHTAGDLPLWLAPVQVRILPISDRHLDAAKTAAAIARRHGVRAHVDERTESVGRKIRDGELAKSPYMLVIGDREAEEGTVSVRARHEGDLGSRPVDEFLDGARRYRGTPGAVTVSGRTRPRRALRAAASKLGRRGRAGELGVAPVPDGTPPNCAVCRARCSPPAR